MSSPSPAATAKVSERPLIWITGCAQGVGAQLVRSALEHDFDVLATDIDLAGLKQRAAEESWPQERVLIKALDVRSSDAWEQCYQSLIASKGRLDVLVNNAGVIQPGFLLEASEASLDLHLDVNLKGVILGSQLAGHHMSETGQGHIINIASLAGVAPITGLGYYSVSKYGVRAYSLILAEELAAKGVSVSVLCPDLIRTGMLDLQLDYPDEAALTFSGGTPLTVEQIADCVFNRILPKAPIEVLLPSHRGWLAKMSNVFPQTTHLLGNYLRRKGKAKILAQRPGSRPGKASGV